MCHLMYSLCLSGLPTVSLGYTTLIGFRLYLQPMFVTFTNGINELQYPYGPATINAAYVSKLFVDHHWVTP